MTARLRSARPRTWRRRLLALLAAMTGSLGWARTVTIVQADRLELRNLDSQELVIISGARVELKIDDDLVLATRVEYNRSKRTLTIIGPGRYETTQQGARQVLTGSDLVVDLATQGLSGEDVLVSDAQLELRGEAVNRVPGQLTATRSYFTPCARCGRTPNDYAFRADRVQLYPGDRLVAYGAVVLLADFPVAYLPVLVLPLNDQARQPRFSIGTSGLDGYTVAADLPFFIGTTTLGTTLLRYYQNRAANFGFGVDLQSYRPLPFIDRLDLYAQADPRPLIQTGTTTTAPDGYDVSVRFGVRGRFLLPSTVNGVTYSLSAERSDIGRALNDAQRGVTDLNGTATAQFPDLDVTLNYSERLGDKRETVTLPRVLKQPELVLDPKPVSRGTLSADFRVTLGRYSAPTNPLSRLSVTPNYSTLRLEENHVISYGAKPWRGADFSLSNTFTGRYYGNGARVVDLNVTARLVQNFGPGLGSSGTGSSGPAAAGQPAATGTGQARTGQTGAGQTGTGAGQPGTGQTGTTAPTAGQPGAAPTPGQPTTGQPVTGQPTTGQPVTAPTTGQPGAPSPGLETAGAAAPGSAAAGTGSAAATTPAAPARLPAPRPAARPFGVTGSFALDYTYLRQEGTSPFAFDAVPSRRLSGLLSGTLNLVPAPGLAFSVSQGYDFVLPREQQTAANFGVTVTKAPVNVTFNLKQNIFSGLFESATLNSTVGRPGQGLLLGLQGSLFPAAASTFAVSLDAAGGARTNTFGVTATFDLKRQVLSTLGLRASAVRTQDAVLNPLSFTAGETFTLPQTTSLSAAGEPLTTPQTTPGTLAGSQSLTWRDYTASGSHSLTLPTGSPGDTVYYGLSNRVGSPLAWSLRYGGTYNLEKLAWRTPQLTASLTANRDNQRLSAQATLNVPGLDQKRLELASANVAGNYDFERVSVAGSAYYTRSRVGTAEAGNESFTDTYSFQPLNLIFAFGAQPGNGRPAAYVTTTLRQTLTYRDGVRQGDATLRPIILLTVDRCCWAFQAEINPVDRRFRVSLGLPGSVSLTAFDATPEGVSVPLLTPGNQTTR